MKPVRTPLFAPGIKERVMTKALESGADSVILDLEDSVPLASKAEARVLVSKIIDSAASNLARPAIYVRVNAAGTGLLADDLDAVVRPGLEAILIAKAETMEDVQVTATAIDRLEPQRNMARGSVGIILMLETALGVHNCFDLIKTSPRVGATCFGSARDGDLQTDLGCAWSIEGTELLYARSKVLLDTRAAGSHVYPLDGVFSDLNDEAALIADSRLSARLWLYRSHGHSPQTDCAGEKRLRGARSRGHLLSEGGERVCGGGKSWHGCYRCRWKIGGLRDVSTC